MWIVMRRPNWDRTGQMHAVPDLQAVLLQDEGPT